MTENFDMKISLRHMPDIRWIVVYYENIYFIVRASFFLFFLFSVTSLWLLVVIPRVTGGGGAHHVGNITDIMSHDAPFAMTPQLPTMGVMGLNVSFAMLIRPSIATMNDMNAVEHSAKYASINVSRIGLFHPGDVGNEMPLGEWCCLFKEIEHFPHERNWFNIRLIPICFAPDIFYPIQQYRFTRDFVLHRMYSIHCASNAVSRISCTNEGLFIFGWFQWLRCKIRRSEFDPFNNLSWHI